MYIRPPLCLPVGWYVCVLSQDWLFYKRPGNLGAVLSLAVPRTVLFWTEISDVVPGIYWSRSSNLGVTTPNAPVTTESTLVFLFFLTLLPDLAVCQDVANPAVIQKKTIAFFCSLSTTTLSGWFPLDLGDFKWGKGLPVHYPRHLVVLLSVHSFHLTSCYFVLNSHWGTFGQPATWVLSGVVDSYSTRTTITTRSEAVSFKLAFLPAGRISLCLPVSGTAYAGVCSSRIVPPPVLH